MTTAATDLGVFAHLVAMGVLAIQAFAGARVLDWLGIGKNVRAHERILFGWALGLSITALVGMLLAGTGTLGPWSAAALLVALAALSWPAPRELTADCVRVLRTLDLPTQVSLGFGILALGLWSAPLLAETLLPNSDWDSALYHLPLADRYVSGHLWSRDPYFPAFSFPGAVHMVYALLIALRCEAAIVPMNFWIIVLLLTTTVAVGRRIGGRNGSLWASVLFTTTPILWQLGVDARIDGFLCLTLLLAAYAVVGFVQEGEDVQLELAAIALGASLGCKYTALPFVVVLPAVALVFRLRSSVGTQGLRRLLATGAVFVAVPNGAWYAANLVLHGDPVFPILRGDYMRTAEGERQYIERGDVAESVSLMRDPDMQARLAALEARPHARPPANLFDVFDLVRNPDRYAVKPHHSFNALLLLSLLMPLALPSKPERRRGALVLWAIGWGGFALLGSQANVLRYAAPVLPMLAATGGLLISRLRWRGLRVAIAVGVVLVLARDFQIERARLALLRPAEALGDPSAWEDPATRIEWLEHVGYNFTPPIAYAARHINEMLADGRMPRNSRVLMVGEGKGRLIECETIPDSSWFAHRFVAELTNADLDHAALAARLRDQGITHVLYNQAYYDWVASDTDTARSRLAFALTHVERFLARHGRLIYQGGGMQLYDIRARRAR